MNSLACDMLSSSPVAGFQATAVQSVIAGGRIRMWFLWPSAVDGRAIDRRGQRKRRSRGFSTIELVVVMTIGVIVTAIAIPVIGSAMNSMRMNAMISDISGAIGKTRYRAIMTSQVYTLAITAPANTYVVKNINTNGADNVMPLSGHGAVQINGGVNGVYTFTLCPNGTVYGVGGTCPGAAVPPVLTISYGGRITNISTSGVGNVSTNVIH